MFLEAVDENPDREGLKETPKRFAKYWMELLEGQKYTNKEIAKNQVTFKCGGFTIFFI